MPLNKQLLQFCSIGAHIHCVCFKTICININSCKRVNNKYNIILKESISDLQRISYIYMADLILS